MVLACAWSAGAAKDQILLTVDPPPKEGRVVARVDLTEVARWCGVAVAPGALRAFAEPGGQPVAAQFVSDEGRPAAGTLVLGCQPGKLLERVRLDFSGPPQTGASQSTTVRTPWYRVVHDPARMGGLPAEITFAGTERKFVPGDWNDRLYHRQSGQFWLRYDRQPRVQCLSTGPLCTVIRVSARYCRPDGTSPAGQPGAVYDWFYFKDQPLVYVRAVGRQAVASTWHEAHFLELGFSTNGFSRWAGGGPVKEGAFAGGEESRRFNRWAAVLDGPNAIGMFDAGALLVYDGRGYGRYLHAQADEAWREWTLPEFERSAWLRIAAEAKPAEALAAAAAGKAGRAVVSVSTERVQERIEGLRAMLRGVGDKVCTVPGWQLGLARLLDRQGRFGEAIHFGGSQLPAGWRVVAAGHLRLILESRADGIALGSVLDAATGKLLTSPEVMPLFEMVLRDSSTNEIRVRSDRGWGQAEIQTQSGSNDVVLRWANPQETALGPLVVTARIRPDPGLHRLSWSFEAQGQSNAWSIWQGRFPQLALSAEGPESQLLLPQAAGVLKAVGREPLARFQGDYPSGWMTMQLAALYDPAAATGLYFGLHDPLGATKQFVAESGAHGRAVRLAWDIPPPQAGQPGNRFVLPGQAVWQLLRGDWFDAAVIYRDWARWEAKWFPVLTEGSRADTPSWMRDLCAWAMTGGSSNECVPQVLEFAKALGVPVGFHWYNWHQIPFDNDYPHYFPARNGFAEGVKELQAGGVFVMPYINGRLWDTRDRGAVDFEFTRLARPAAVKDFKGDPRVESYGSQETNGQPVRLAVMCPATRLWQERQHEIVTRLFNECGVKGVYIDQIAAAKAELCFDAAHGHPVGGGSWWNEQGYWPLLDGIRRDMPAGRMLTTECNAEPFLRWFDGYLTWHWQYDGQVPLFPAVYGGAVQMFGRAYRGGPTKDLALRMKAAQQLVWGEQLGWLDPSLVREPENLAFFRDAVRLRWNLRRYFSAGQMARPPKLEGGIPNVTADWQWSGVWPVTTPAVMTGAWCLPLENRLVLVFASVASEPVTAVVRYDLREARLSAGARARRLWTPQGSSALPDTGSVLQETVTFAPRSVWAWEVSLKESAKNPVR